MQQRGRKSGAALAVRGGAVEAVKRPEPPLDLTPEESDVWQATVDALPAEWFPRETWPLLSQFCRHTITARRVAQMIDAEMARPELDTAALKDLLGMQKGETAALKALAASMRISQQATLHPESGRNRKQARSALPRPWE